jgi:VWFA-related protein
MKFTHPVIACLTLATASVLNAQNDKPVLNRPAPDPEPTTISQHLDQVILPTVVRDHKGTLVKGLTKDDFSLQVGGKDQKILSFDLASNLPLTIGILADVGHALQDDLPPGTLDEERKTSQAFLQTVLTPGKDKGFVLHFAHNIELLQDVTDSQPRLQKAIALLGTESPTFHTTTDQGTVDSEQRQVHGHGTSLYDSVFLASDEVMSQQKDRKVLIVLTDGIDTGSKDSITDAIESAQRTNTTVYAIYFKAPEPPEKKQQNGNQRGNGNGYPGGRPGGYPGGYPGGGGYPGSPGTGNPGGNNPGGSNPNGTPGTPAHRPSVNGKQVLDRLCGETGGQVFEVSKHQTIEEIYAQIAEELRSQYRIGFVPTNDVSRSGYHQIDMRLTGPNKDKKLDVQVRAGYYTGN